MFRNKADELKKARLKSHPEVSLYHAAVDAQKTPKTLRDRPAGATIVGKCVLERKRSRMVCAL